MVLADDERADLEGHNGEARSIAMALLVQLGESFGARRLIPVASAHILAHYGSLHDAGVDFLERLAAGGGRCTVPTTVDPSSVDFSRWRAFRVPEEYAKKQDRLRAAVELLGVIPSWSCTPYLSMNVPRFGQAIAWAESSAVVYANSVIGARTNRTAFGLDICAAITGKIPESGLYLDENRKGSLLFDVDCAMSDLDYHTLGAFVGSKAGAAVPVIKGVSPHATNDQLKTFGAGAASAGSVALYHMIGVTPEARLGDPFGNKKPQHVFTVKRGDLDEMEQRITTASPGAKVDMVTIGCPLLSLRELAEVQRKMQGRQVKKGVHFWIYLSEETYGMARKLGMAQPLEKAGAWLSTQTCATISPVKVWKFSHVMTNSAKCALVVPSEHGVAISYRSTDECILAATVPDEKVKKVRR